MPLVLKDRVKETTSTTGTGSLTLLGASTGYQTFSTAIGNGNTTYYTIQSYNGSEWEVGIGTVSAGTLSRDTVLSSSTGAKVSFSAGTKDVFCTYPAGKSVYTDASNYVSGYTIENSTIGATTASTGRFSDLTDTGLTSGRVTYASTGGNLVDSANLTFNGTTLTTTGVVTPSVTASSTDLTLSAISTGAIKFNTLNGEQVRISDATVTGQYTSFSRNAGQNIQLIGAMGTANLGLYATGGGVIRFLTASDLTKEQFRVADTASAVNYVQVTGSATGTGSVISTQGSDTNVNLLINPKGTGNVGIGTGAVQPSFPLEVRRDQNGTTEISLYNANTVTSPTVNARYSLRTSASGSPTGGGAYLGLQGNNLRLWNDFGNPVVIATNSTQMFRFLSASSVVNNFTVVGSSTTQAPIFAAEGSDTNISMAFQPKGTGAIDLAAGSSGVNISNGGTVTAITRTALGTSYTSPPTVNISAPTTAGGVQATATVPLQQISPMTIVSGGTGYTVGDTLTVSGGTWTTVPTMTVATVSAGVITSITQVNYGVGTVIPSNPISVTGGTGTGATFSTTAWGIGASFTITNAGSGYIEQPTVTFSGGGGSGASAYATVGSATTIKSIGRTSEASLIFQTPSSITSNLPAMRINDGAAGYDTFTQIQPASAYTVVSAVGNAGANLFLSATGAGSVRLMTGGTSLVEQMRVSNTASAVNFVQVTGASTTNSPNLTAQGSDTNISIYLSSKGTGTVRFFTNGAGSEQFRVLHTAGTIVNYATATGSATGVAPAFSVAGTDTNIDLSLTTKGTGAVRLNTGNGEAFRASQSFLTGTAVNYIDASGRQTGLGPILSTNGSDTNVRFNITAKGNEAVGIYTNLANQLQFNVTHTASAVNYVQVTGGATGGTPRISTQGSDSLVSFGVSSKGGGDIFFQTNGSSNTGFLIKGSTTAVNYLQVAGNATTVAPVLSAQGSDTNIDLSLTPKGTGGVAINSAIKLGAGASAGTSGQVLTSAGAGASPTWSTVSGSGGMTLLGTITPTAVNSVSLGSLTLTSYKSLYIVFNGIGGTGTGNKVLFVSSNNQQSGGGASFSGSSTACSGTAWLDLGTGAIGGCISENTVTSGTSTFKIGGLTNVATSTTTLYFRYSSTDNFAAIGSIVIYGVS